MAKNMNVINAIPIAKSNTSPGAREESKMARTKSGNRSGYRSTMTRKKDQH